MAADFLVVSAMVVLSGGDVACRVGSAWSCWSSSLIVLTDRPGPGRRGWDAGKIWKHRERKRGKETSCPDHGRTQFANQWRTEIPQDLQASVHPVNGGGYDRFSEPLRKFWSRRRQSTSVNGVCQAQTTTSSILDESGGIKDHNSRKCLCRIAGSRMGGGFERCRASGRAALCGWDPT